MEGTYARLLAKLHFLTMQVETLKKENENKDREIKFLLDTIDEAVEKIEQIKKLQRIKQQKEKKANDPEGLKFITIIDLDH